VTQIPPSDVISVDLRVPFHDVDTLRVVWHGHYVKYLELARIEYLRKKQLSIPELEAMGVMLMVTQTRVKHVSPLRDDDQFRVSARLVEHRVRLDFEFEVLNLTSKKRAATGRSVLVALRLPSAELCLRIPDEIIRRLES